MEPIGDGFKNFLKKKCSNIPAEQLLIDKAQLLGLSVPEMSVLVAGMRVLEANYSKNNFGVFTEIINFLKEKILQTVILSGMPQEWI